MPNLSNINITFNTHQNKREATTVLHVFVKNRSNTSSDPEKNTSFIGNLLAYQSHRDSGAEEINPYLGFAKSLSQGVEFGKGSSHSFDLHIRETADFQPAKISKEEIRLPVVNIHILPSENGGDRWIFDYSVKFSFDDGSSSFFSSNINGIKGIILDENNRDHSGICSEITPVNQADFAKPDTDAVLTKVILEFATHNDDKHQDTHLNVHIVNRISATRSDDIAIGLNILPNQVFPASDPRADGASHKIFIWSASGGFPLASPSILLRDIVLPQIFIVINPLTPPDTWIFDYRLTFEFSGDGHTYTTRANGIILNEEINKYTGVYQGNSFPTVTPTTKPGTRPVPVTDREKIKRISLSFLQKKLDEILNSRQGLPGQYPPMVKLRFHNAGAFDTVVRLPGHPPIAVGPLPDSYLDIQSLEAEKTGPGSIDVKYSSSPMTLGQLAPGGLNIGALYFNDINSKAITLNIITGENPHFLKLKIDFECNGPVETAGGFGQMDFTQFYLEMHLTLDIDPHNQKIDLMSWVDEIAALLKNPDGNLYSGKLFGNTISRSFEFPEQAKLFFLSRPIDIQLHTTDLFGVTRGEFVGVMTSKIYDLLTLPDRITRRTVRDDINSAINSFLLGGATDDAISLNNTAVHSVHIEGDNLVISYTGPKDLFAFEVPHDWPSTNNPDSGSEYDFAPGTLNNIDHIVVLTMENRSFDHMLGYLSLPASKGGMGRAEVDGLKGGESNLYKGHTYPSYPIPAGETVFSPDPPHSYEPVQHAINGGAMDGFVKSYAGEHGDAVAGRIMGYHTGVNIPVYDALVRDFAICNRWFASHPGSTFPNRFFELSGRLNIDVRGFWELSNSSPIRPAFTKTIFDHLTDYQHVANGLSWNYFEAYYCFLRFFEKYTFDTDNIIDVNDRLNGFFAKARTGNLPSVSFIDPHFVELPPDGNCDGPPADIKEGQVLVQKIVEAVVASPNWNKTMLIITYDEHGGFFDHVPPPAAPITSKESTIKTCGVRVPTFVISPWVKASSVFGHDAAGQNTSLYFDHTSILKTIAKRFMSDNPPYMGPRYAAANDLSEVIGNTLFQPQFRPFLRYNIVYNASQKSLDVKGGVAAIGTALWQFDINGTAAQDFSFEDAGEGFFYIRTHVGNLYISVDVQIPPDVAADAAGPSAALVPYGIKQDVKYPGGLPHNNLHRNPDFQKWKMAPANQLVNNELFIITNAFFPDKVLQPLHNDIHNGATIVLDVRTPGVFINNKNTWRISSPLINHSIPTHL